MDNEPMMPEEAGRSAPGPAAGADEGLDPKRADALKQAAAQDPVQDATAYLDGKSQVSSTEHRVREHLNPTSSIFLTEVHEVKAYLRAISRNILIFCAIVLSFFIGFVVHPRLLKLKVNPL